MQSEYKSTLPSFNNLWWYCTSSDETRSHKQLNPVDPWSITYLHDTTSRLLNKSNFSIYKELDGFYELNWFDFNFY